MNRDRFYEDDLNDYLKMLISTNRLEGTAKGVTLQVINQGIDSLSEKQLYRFEEAMSQNMIEECQLCGGQIPWSEMSGAEDNGGYCSWCARHDD